jgi:maleylacetoacetate isomerase/maleylpyruvate isomerase
MKFYEAVVSSASFRVRIALALKGLSYESVVLDLRAKDHLTEEYGRVNPMRAVPSLELAPGQTLIESMAIVEYLDERYPEPPLLPADALAKARVRAMAQIVACNIHPLNNLRVLRYLSRELTVDEAARDKWYAHWVREGFKGLEPMLPETGSFAYGGTPTIADLFIVPQVANAIRYKVDIADFPRVRRVYDVCMRLPAFSRSHPDNHPRK